MSGERGRLIAGRYRLGRLLGQGGMGRVAQIGLGMLDALRAAHAAGRLAGMVPRQAGPVRHIGFLGFRLRGYGKPDPHDR